MSFYLTVPRGEVTYQKLEEFALSRCRLLLRLVQCTEQDDKEAQIDDVLQDASLVLLSDCLMAGTPKDGVSHYILRLLLGGEAQTSNLFVTGETMLFKSRLDTMDWREWSVFFKTLDRSFFGKAVDIKPIHNCEGLQVLQDICSSLKAQFPSWSTLASSLCLPHDGLPGSRASVQLPFTCVAALVGRRLVDLDKGVATLPLHLLRSVLVQVYQTVMTQAVRKAQGLNEQASMDERLKHLKKLLKRECHGHCPPVTPRGHRLHLNDLNLASSMFPPCMEKLTRDLSERHRLPHHDRIQLTLFLKDAGLSLHDALLLWKREYSQPEVKVHRSSSSCGHSWQGSEARYTYSIRHLYGLEGRRADYQGHSCQTIQTRSSPTGCGNCPFVQLDSTVTSSLTSDSHTMTCLTDLSGRGQYSQACWELMSSRIDQSFPPSLSEGPGLERDINTCPQPLSGEPQVCSDEERDLDISSWNFSENRLVCSVDKHEIVCSCKQSDLDGKSAIQSPSSTRSHPQSILEQASLCQESGVSDITRSTFNTESLSCNLSCLSKNKNKSMSGCLKHWSKTQNIESFPSKINQRSVAHKTNVITDENLIEKICQSSSHRAEQCVHENDAERSTAFGDIETTCGVIRNNNDFTSVPSIKTAELCVLPYHDCVSYDSNSPAKRQKVMTKDCNSTTFGCFCQSKALSRQTEYHQVDATQECELLSSSNSKCRHLINQRHSHTHIKQNQVNVRNCNMQISKHRSSNIKLKQRRKQIDHPKDFYFNFVEALRKKIID